jgi:hypothetical protein
MEVGTIVLFVVVGFFGLGSTVLGFIAESTKLTVSIHSEFRTFSSSMTTPFCSETLPGRSIGILVAAR